MRTYLNPGRFGAALATGAAVIMLLSACHAPDRVVEERARIDSVDVLALRIFDGSTGAPANWDNLLDRAGDAEVIILGEQHDDGVAHKTQFHIVKQLAGEGVALSMEMLERHEQSTVDDFLAGYLDRERFMEEVASTRWRQISGDFLSGKIKETEFRSKITALGWPDWEYNYQPMIDAIKEGGGRVVAANAPWMRYTKLVTLKDGYAGFDSLSEAQRPLVEAPTAVPTGGYRERFWQIMAGRKEGEPVPPAPADADASNPHSRPMTDEVILEGFMKQLLYDATMADSIADALASGASRVIHLVGQFHSDFEGGTVLELRARRAGVRVLTVSLVPGEGSALAPDDSGRADFVIYTGVRPPEEG